MKLPKPTNGPSSFMATTAEEAGLLGAKYYAENPLYPLEKTLADINIDGTSVWGKTRDIEDISDGNSDLDDLLGEAATAPGPRPGSEQQTRERQFLSRRSISSFRNSEFPRSTLAAAKTFPDKPRASASRKWKNSSRNIITSPPMKSIRLGSFRRRAGRAAALRSRLPGREWRQISRMETGQRIQSQAGRDAGQAAALETNFPHRLGFTPHDPADCARRIPGRFSTCV